MKVNNTLGLQTALWANTGGQAVKSEILLIGQFDSK